MADDPVRPTDGPALETVLDALDDADCRAILRATTDPMTANELTAALDTPESTLYRKLNLLVEASLVREDVRVNPDGGRTTRYQRDVEAVTVSVDEDLFEVSIDRPAKRPDERLADIWSKMGEEL